MTVNSSAAASLDVKPSDALDQTQAGLSSRINPDNRKTRGRGLTDKVMRWGISFGGSLVIVAISLIFVFLFSVTLPLFESAKTEQKPLQLMLNGAPVFMDLEEQGAVISAIDSTGLLVFYSADTQEPITSHQLLSEGVTVSAVSQSNAESKITALGLSDGSVLVIKLDYQVSYPDGVRTVTPGYSLPLKDVEFSLVDGQTAIESISLQILEDYVGIAALSKGQIIVQTFSKEVSMWDDSVVYEASRRYLSEAPGNLAHLQLSSDMQKLVAVNEGSALLLIEVNDNGELKLQERVVVGSAQDPVISLRFLTGGSSLIAGTASGQLSQWMVVRDGAGVSIKQIRVFENAGASVEKIVPEARRKGFIVSLANGQHRIYHATANRLVAQLPGDTPAEMVSISPRADKLAIARGGQVELWAIQNEHPDVSMSVLWQSVWYENYKEPAFIWQSSASDNDFEPKFSLVPLTLGTLKGAFYAILFAAPLAIAGAIFTAQFMTPTMRNVVKPTIEIMEALPTVILGFLAGLWLAPLVENNLPGIFSLFITMPFGILLVAALWRYMPRQIQNALNGYEALILIPVLIAMGWLSLGLSPVIENQFLGGNAQIWMRDTLGVNYDQRNALVVGFAMGFAVIPTIFTIAEDALFSVPQYLIRGSLALGATPWQTLVGVVLPTASPAIFTALMMGIGRAVGETMIVLMATGNTPVMDFSIFEGMRTFSANIAVEMPEAEVESTHYRILFLAALVLFMFTFVFNTAAEVIRQNLRKKYGSL